jgi:outer membrane protein TolC
VQSDERIIIAVFLAASIALPPSLAAQEASLRLTLDEAIVRASRNSHRIAGLEAKVDAAAAQETGHKAADRPVVALLGGYTRTNHVEEFVLRQIGQPLTVLYPDAPDNYRARFDLQWPIYTAGRTAALERAARSERTAASFDVAAASADLRLETTRAFWALVTARQTEGVVARSIESIDAHVAELRARLEQGLIPPNEVLSAEAQRSRQRLLAIEARNVRGVAEADLRRLIGEPTPTAIETVAPVAPPEPTPTASADIAQSSRPERQALASRIEAARERESAAAAAGRPQVAVAAGYDYARPNPHIFPRADEWQDSWDVSVNVSWTLWDGGRRRAEEAEAAAGTRGSVARAADFDRDLAFEIEQRRLEADSAHAAIEAAEDGLRAAVEARRVVGERFAAGVATSAEVLDAQTDVLAAELERTRAIANARLARARLDRALGRI